MPLMVFALFVFMPSFNAVVKVYRLILFDIISLRLISREKKRTGVPAAAMLSHTCKRKVVFPRELIAPRKTSCSGKSPPSRAASKSGKPVDIALKFFV